MRQTGDVLIAELAPGHFGKFHSWVAGEGARWQSWPRQRDRLTRVKSVLKYVRRKYAEWPWPAGVLEWADSYSVKPHKPQASNREPMKPENANGIERHTEAAPHGSLRPRVALLVS